MPTLVPSEPPHGIEIGREVLFRPGETAPRFGMAAVSAPDDGRLGKPGRIPGRRAAPPVDGAGQPADSCDYKIAVLSLKGGVGKTTTTVGLGSTFAALRGDHVVAVDANPDRGTLAGRIPSQTAATVRDLLNDAENVHWYSDVRAFTSQEFPAPVIAAQLSQESNFSDPTSSTGAEGPAQFEPATWVAWGNGGNVHDPVAAIEAQGRFDCALAGQVKAAQAAGQLHSSALVTELALGAYNAGFGAVLTSGGIPQNSQTMAYVPRIMTLARTTFSDAGTITAPRPARTTCRWRRWVQAAGGCGGVDGQVAVHQVTYPVPGGGTQPADLYVPAGAGPGIPPRPIIVMVHGGGYVAGDRTELGDAAKAAASHGYLVLNISYDLSAPRWPRQLQQVGAAIDYVRAQGTAQGIDPARVGLLGDSAGAGLVLEAGLLGDHHAVQAVVSWSGPTDSHLCRRRQPPATPISRWRPW